MSKKVLSLVGGVVASLLLAASVVAAPTNTKPQSSVSPGQGIELTPVVLDIAADPGETITRVIKVRNVTPQPLVASPEFNDFVAGDETGTPKILFDTSQSSPYPIKDWFSGLSAVRVNPGEQTSVTVTIKVPDSASVGGHYGVIRFTAKSADPAQTGASLSASVGALVLLRVNGDIKEEIDLAEFSVNQDGKSASFFEQGPLNFVERIRNTGNIHVPPRGEVQIKDMFGRGAGTLAINDIQRPATILPGSTRKFEQTFGDPKSGAGMINLFGTSYLFGRYQATLNLTAGTKNISSDLTFWIIPYKLIAIIILIIVVIIVTLRLLIHAYNKWLISQVAHKQEETPPTDDQSDNKKE